MTACWSDVINTQWTSDLPQGRYKVLDDGSYSQSSGEDWGMGQDFYIKVVMLSLYFKGLPS